MLLINSEKLGLNGNIFFLELGVIAINNFSKAKGNQSHTQNHTYFMKSY